MKSKCLDFFQIVPKKLNVLATAITWTKLDAANLIALIIVNYTIPIVLRKLNLAVLSVLIICYCITLIVVIQKLDGVTSINLKKKDML